MTPPGSLLDSRACALDLSLRRADIDSGRSSDCGDAVVDSLEHARRPSRVDLNVGDAQGVSYNSKLSLSMK
jgi:hypothetical protein